MEGKARKAFLATLGTIYRVRDVANFTAGKFEKLVETLVKEGEMKEPEARKFVGDSMDVLHKKAREAQVILEKRAKSLQTAAYREINRMAKEAVKATNPPRKRASAKKKVPK